MREKLKRYGILSEIMQISWPITARKQTNREVAKARNKAYEELYEKLETKEGKMSCSR